MSYDLPGNTSLSGLTAFCAGTTCWFISPLPRESESSLIQHELSRHSCFLRVDTSNRTIHIRAIGSRLPRNALFGQHVSRLNFHTFTKPEFLMLMVIFQPGAMYRLLGISSNELTQEFCDAELMLNPELQSVNDQIANARKYADDD